MPSSDALPSEDALRWMLSTLDDKQRAEFDSGLSKCMYRFEQDRSANTAEALLAHVHSWLVSVTLQHDEDWRGQMAESARRFANDDAGQPVDSDGLRELLGL